MKPGGVGGTLSRQIRKYENRRFAAGNEPSVAKPTTTTISNLRKRDTEKKRERAREIEVRWILPTADRKWSVLGCSNAKMCETEAPVRKKGIVIICKQYKIHFPRSTLNEKRCFSLFRVFFLFLICGVLAKNDILRGLKNWEQIKSKSDFKIFGKPLRVEFENEARSGRGRKGF